MKINYILAILAVAGGLTAAFTNFSERNNLYPTWKYETERVDGQKIHFISANELAELLYRKSEKITILDARDINDYKTYHIPNALSLDETLSDRDLKGKVIVYGAADEGILRESTGKIAGKTFVLKGGLNGWYDQVLFPDFLKYHVRNHDKLEQITDRSLFFGGRPKNSQILNINFQESRFREGC